MARECIPHFWRRKTNKSRFSFCFLCPVLSSSLDLLDLSEPGERRHSKDRKSPLSSKGTPYRKSPMKQSWSKWMLNRVYPVPARLKRFHWTQVLSVRQLKWKDVKLRSTLVNQPREIRCLHKWNCGYHYINWTSSVTESTFSVKRTLQVCI